jgi:hypothetical protein
MARKTETVVTLTDDIDGSARSIETVTFSVDGTAYEIYLGPKNSKALRADFKMRSAHARKSKRTSARRPRGTAQKPVSDAAAIREWAMANGIEVPTRGRIPKAVADQYAAA